MSESLPAPPAPPRIESLAAFITEEEETNDHITTTTTVLNHQIIQAASGTPAAIPVDTGNHPPGTAAHEHEFKLEIFELVQHVGEHPVDEASTAVPRVPSSNARATSPSKGLRRRSEGIFTKPRVHSPSKKAVDNQSVPAAADHFTLPSPVTHHQQQQPLPHDADQIRYRPSTIVPFTAPDAYSNLHAPSAAQHHQSTSGLPGHLSGIGHIEHPVHAGETPIQHHHNLEGVLDQPPPQHQHQHEEQHTPQNQRGEHLAGELPQLEQNAKPPQHSTYTTQPAQHRENLGPNVTVGQNAYLPMENARGEKLAGELHHLEHDSKHALPASQTTRQHPAQQHDEQNVGPNVTVGGNAFMPMENKRGEKLAGEFDHLAHPHHQHVDHVASHPHAERAAPVQQHHEQNVGPNVTIGGNAFMPMENRRGEKLAGEFDHFAHPHHQHVDHVASHPHTERALPDQHKATPIVAVGANKALPMHDARGEKLAGEFQRLGHKDHHHHVDHPPHPVAPSITEHAKQGPEIAIGHNKALPMTDARGQKLAQEFNQLGHHYHDHVPTVQRDVAPAPMAKEHTKPTPNIAIGSNNALPMHDARGEKLAGEFQRMTEPHHHQHVEPHSARHETDHVSPSATHHEKAKPAIAIGSDNSLPMYDLRGHKLAREFNDLTRPHVDHIGHTEELPKAPAGHQHAVAKPKIAIGSSNALPVANAKEGKLVDEMNHLIHKSNYPEERHDTHAGTPSRDLQHSEHQQSTSKSDIRIGSSNPLSPVNAKDQKLVSEFDQLVHAKSHPNISTDLGAESSRDTHLSTTDSKKPVSPRVSIGGRETFAPVNKKDAKLVQKFEELVHAKSHPSVHEHAYAHDVDHHSKTQEKPAPKVIMGSSGSLPVSSAKEGKLVERMNELMHQSNHPAHLDREVDHSAGRSREHASANAGPQVAIGSALPGHHGADGKLVDRMNELMHQSNHPAHLDRDVDRTAGRNREHDVANAAPQVAVGSALPGHHGADGKLVYRMNELMHQSNHPAHLDREVDRTAGRSREHDVANAGPQVAIGSALPGHHGADGKLVNRMNDLMHQTKHAGHGSASSAAPVAANRDHATSVNDASKPQIAVGAAGLSGHPTTKTDHQLKNEFDAHLHKNTSPAQPTGVPAQHTPQHTQSTTHTTPINPSLQQEFDRLHGHEKFHVDKDLHNLNPQMSNNTEFRYENKMAGYSTLGTSAEHESTVGRTFRPLTPEDMAKPGYDHAAKVREQRLSSEFDRISGKTAEPVLPAPPSDSVPRPVESDGGWDPHDRTGADATLGKRETEVPVHKTNSLPKKLSMRFSKLLNGSKSKTDLKASSSNSSLGHSSHDQHHAAKSSPTLLTGSPRNDQHTSPSASNTQGKITHTLPTSLESKFDQLVNQNKKSEPNSSSSSGLLAPSSAHQLPTHIGETGQTTYRPSPHRASFNDIRSHAAAQNKKQQPIHGRHSVSTDRPATTFAPKKERKSLGNVFRGLFSRKSRSSSRNVSTADLPDIPPPADGDLMGGRQSEPPSRVATPEAQRAKRNLNPAPLASLSAPRAPQSRSDLQPQAPASTGPTTDAAHHADLARQQSKGLAHTDSTPQSTKPTGPRASKSRSSLDASRPRNNKLSTSPSPPVPHPKIFLAPNEYGLQGNNLVFHRTASPNGDEEIRISLEENRSVPLIAG
ncbi:hypothetical protein DFS34DRAFT_501161 [Phlyctochytrium arcticum]|nr:hypothetical protein DFS34DRAFT_501161 [Phlyctochytrium arcticum]